jgi:hypothetical protein
MLFCVPSNLQSWLKHNLSGTGKSAPLIKMFASIQTGSTFCAFLLESNPGWSADEVCRQSSLRGFLLHEALTHEEHMACCLWAHEEAGM